MGKIGKSAKETGWIQGEKRPPLMRLRGRVEERRRCENDQNGRKKGFPSKTGENGRK
jgi:hypothetical protein